MRAVFQRDYKKDVLDFCGTKNRRVIGFTELGHPIVAFEFGSNENKRNIFLSGGLHGDEPGGVLFLCNLINQNQFDPKINYFIVPCANPDGYETNQRCTTRGFDINRDFTAEPKSIEAQSIVKYLKERRVSYEVALDLHESGGTIESTTKEEDDAPHEFYMWELNASQNKFGREIIENIRKAGYNTCQWRRIFGDVNNNGVIYYPENRFSEEYIAAASFDVFLEKYYSKVAITTETSIHERLPTRYAILEIVLDAIRRQLP